jgi:hypothetical protein
LKVYQIYHMLFPDTKISSILRFSGIIISLLVPLVLFDGCGDKKTGQSGDSFLTEITDQVKIDFVHDPAIDGKYYMPESIGSGGAFLDYDNDGDLDIYLLNGAIHDQKNKHKAPIKNHLYRQETNGTFTDVTDISGLGDPGYGMGVAVGDINNDGYVDVYISNDGPDALYRNNGDGTFTDITVESGIDNPDWGVSVTFLDYNLDSFLDVSVVNYVDYDTAVACLDRVGQQDYCGPQGFPGYADRLFRNNGDGTFNDVSVESGIAAQPSAGLGIISADFNNDFYPDIYVSNDRKNNHLWINQKNGTFQDNALMYGAALNGLGMAEASMGITLGDVDNDNDADLFLTHFGGETNTFFRNEGEIGFQDETTAASLSVISLPYTGFGTGFFDYDHDGDLDLAIVNGRVIRGPVLTKREPVEYWDHYAEPNLVFENDGRGKFSDVSSQALSFTSRVENSRALVFGDIDNDGDVDLMVTNEGGRARLYRNEKEKRGNWLMIRAMDAMLQRDMYGGRITVYAGNKTFLRLINAGYSFCASHDPRAHFGLGDITKIDKIIITWPGGETESFTDIAVNQAITLYKGQGRIITQ